MAILPIVRYPHDVLLHETEPVREITPDVRRLVGDMIETMPAAPGVGLAANHVVGERRLAVVGLTRGEKAPQLLVLINPRVIENSGGYVADEGCLSLPGFTQRVRRPDRCGIEAMHLDGQVRRLERREHL